MHNNPEKIGKRKCGNCGRYQIEDDDYCDYCNPCSVELSTYHAWGFK